MALRGRNFASSDSNGLGDRAKVAEKTIPLVCWGAVVIMRIATGPEKDSAKIAD